MAVDTRDKRFSMLGLASPVRREQKNPTGTIAAVAREMLLFLYAGIALAAPTSYSVSPNHKLIIPQRNNTLIVPPRINQLTHDF